MYNNPFQIKYKNKYRIQSHRKPKWDYSAEALYFLTIVTQKMKCNLGRIVNNEMNLSDFGKIVEQEWFRSFEIRNELILHEFVVMPNHLHAIVEICIDNGDEFAVDDMDVNNIVVDEFTAVDEFAIDEYSDEMLQTHGRVSVRQNPTSPHHSWPDSNPPSTIKLII